MTDHSFDPHEFCTVLSEQAKEPLYGTAVHVHTWFLLQYDGSWQAEAANHNDLPPHIQNWLNEQVNAVENGRLQFIRQQPKQDKLAFFIAIADDAAPRLYHFLLDTNDDLFSLDVPAIIAGDAVYNQFIRTEPLFLVCTNGKRDRCCAKFGAPVYQSLATQVDADAWQTTHLGGHRFSATGLVFPNGVSYGRLAPDAIADFVSTIQQGDIPLNHYRGRCCYTSAEQAAEYFLRQQTGQLTADYFRHVVSQGNGRSWQIQFTSSPTPILTVRLAQLTEKRPMQASCGSPKIKPAPIYQLEEIK